MKRIGREDGRGRNWEAISKEMVRGIAGPKLCRSRPARCNLRRATSPSFLPSPSCLTARPTSRGRALIEATTNVVNCRARVLVWQQTASFRGWKTVSSPRNAPRAALTHSTDRFDEDSEEEVGRTSSQLFNPEKYKIGCTWNFVIRIRRPPPCPERSLVKTPEIRATE